MRSTAAIDKYEAEFSRFLGTRFGFGFWKGRVALYAILKSLGIGSGDEVILPGFTCVVVPNAIRFAGARPVFADIAARTYNLNPSSVEESITPRTRALIVQHTFGIPADLDSLLAISKRHGLAVIEDCAHALGSTHRGLPLGGFGDAAFFSSQWSKPFTTGLGGLAITSDERIAKRLQIVTEQFADPPGKQVMRLRAQYELYRRFFSPRLYWQAVGILKQMSRWRLFVASSSETELEAAEPVDKEWRMSAFQAKVGVRQIKDLERNVAHRRTLATFYEDYLKGHGWELPETLEHSECAFLRYPIRVANKSELLQKAEYSRVEIGSWFDSALHPIRHSLERFGYSEGQCPVAEQTANEVINLPVHLGVSAREAEQIVNFVCKHAVRPTVAEPQLSPTSPRVRIAPKALRAEIHKHRYRELRR
jgi:perosamine synthetase